MKPAFVATATIDRPPEEVWAVLTDWDRAPEWMRGIDRMTAEGPTRAGTALRFEARGKVRTSEIVACEPGREVALRSVQGGVTANYTYTLTADDEGGTAVTLVATCRSQGVFWRMLSPLIRTAMKWSDRGQVAALRALIADGTSVRK